MLSVLSSSPLLLDAPAPNLSTILDSSTTSFILVSHLLCHGHSSSLSCCRSRVFLFWNISLSYVEIPKICINSQAKFWTNTSMTRVQLCFGSGLQKKKFDWLFLWPQSNLLLLARSTPPSTPDGFVPHHRYANGPGFPGNNFQHHDHPLPTVRRPA